MGGLFTVLAVIAAGAASVYFVTASLGPQLIRKKSVSTILKGVKARQRTTPQTPLHEIYAALVEERAQQSHGAGRVRSRSTRGTERIVGRSAAGAPVGVAKNQMVIYEHHEEPGEFNESRGAYDGLFQSAR